jgi:hypothetical protein
LKVIETFVQVGLQSDNQKEDLIRKIESRQKVATLTRGAHLLSVRQHEAVISQRVAIRQPISFEIEVRHKSV